MSYFETIEASSLTENFFNRIGKEWSLITAGDSKKCNTMTASWGGVGVLWNKNVTYCFIRQSRYTLEFMDREDYYSISFFGIDHRKELAYCGKVSGREVDKIAETGLTPVFDREAPYFAEADLVLICKKLYRQTMTPECFADSALVSAFYSDGDYHETFVGEIVSVLKKS